MASSQAIDLRVENLEASRAALERVIRAEKAALPEALDVIGQEWVSEIRRRAPLLTGRLRRSYTWEVGRETGGRYVEVSSNVEYAAAQELGTRWQDGTPHVRPSTDVIIRRVPALVAEGMGRRAQGLRLGSGSSGAGRLAQASTRLGALGG